MRFWGLLVGKDLGDRVAGYIGSGAKINASLSITLRIPVPSCHYRLPMNHDSRLKKSRQGTSAFDMFLTSILISISIQNPNNYKIVQLP